MLRLYAKLTKKVNFHLWKNSMINQFSINIDRPLATVEVLGFPQNDITANQYIASASNGNNQSGKEIERFYQTIKTITDKLNQFHEKLVNEYKKGIVKLSVEIARKILVQKIGERDYSIESIIEEALKNTPTRKDISIRLNPEDFIKCQNTQQANGQNIFTGINLVSDPDIKPAECAIETPKGIVESFVEVFQLLLCGEFCISGFIEQRFEFLYDSDKPD